MNEAMARALEAAVEQIKAVQEDARVHGNLSRHRWPMIIFNSPKGRTGHSVVDGLPVEGTFRAHQVTDRITDRSRSSASTRPPRRS